MKVALSILACLLVANAAVLPQKGLGVTKGEIDKLVKDAVVMIDYRDWIHKMVPYKVDNVEIPINIEGLKVKMVDATSVLRDELEYSESSSLSDDELDLSVDFGVNGASAGGKLLVTGTYQGKQVDQQGNIVIITPTFVNKIAFKAQLTPDSVTLVDADYASNVADFRAFVNGIKINGISQSDLEKAIAEGVKDYYKKSEEQFRKQLPEMIKFYNKLIGKLNLQIVYVYLRNLVPSS